MSVAAGTFLELHRQGSPLVMPNPWDVGSARLLAELGFAALATTSSGYAASLGRLDGSLTKGEALSHAAAIVEAVEVPVSADLENGYADTPEAIASTVEAAIEIGLAGCSIEDVRGGRSYDIDLATERVAAAVAAAAGRIVVTARAENFLAADPDLSDTIARLRRYQEAGADVLYAPGVVRREDLEAILQSVDRPVNVLLLPGGPSIPELAELGASRISLGGSLAFAAFGALAAAARELAGPGPYAFWGSAAAGRELVRAAATASKPPR